MDKPKFKFGDRVVVSTTCPCFGVLGGGDDHTIYHGKHGVVMSVFAYYSSEPDYDVYIDDFPEQHNNGCPAFDETWLTLEIPNGN